MRCMGAGLLHQPIDRGIREPTTTGGVPPSGGTPPVRGVGTYLSATVTPPEKAESCNSIDVGVVPAGTSKTTLLFRVFPGLTSSYNDEESSRYIAASLSAEYSWP